MSERCVIVATDFSESAKAASQWAIKHFPGATLHHVSCYQPLESFVSGELVYAPSDQEQAAVKDANEKLLSQFLKENVEASGVTYTGHLVQGDPRDVIPRLATEWAVDAVVVGSHGKGMLKRALLGSTSTHLAQHCNKPVVIVRASDKA